MRLLARLWGALGRIRVRLLVVTLIVLLVPVAGLEFARLYERQLLGALQRDMRNQAVLLRATLREDLAEGVPLADPRHGRAVTRAATQTRMRVRILGARGELLLDSHERGPPEGPEPEAPSLLSTPMPSVLPRLDGGAGSYDSPGSVPVLASRRAAVGRRWPAVPQRVEVRDALAGRPSARTRVREREPAVLLFVTEPIRHEGEVVGVVYVVRSTQPVLLELYRIRAGLLKVLAVALGITLLITLILSLSISRPLARLSRAAKRIAAGEREVVVPVGGGGEIGELGESIAAMTDELRLRARYVSELAADVAHEFKSPLTSIRGAAELLNEGAADDPEARARFLGNIGLDAERLDRLVSRLLELSRIEASSDAMTTFDLEALVRRVVDREQTPSQPVELRWRASSRMFRGREADLETALRNLVENAVRFSPEDAPVVVTVEGAAGGGEIRIDVADRGPGVPVADREKIFDRFFTTDADRNGTGLGLAIVRSVAAAHGGTVGVAGGERDGGAVFSLRLPVR